MNGTTRPPTITELITSGRLTLQEKHRNDLGDGRILSLIRLELAGHVSEPAHTHPGFEVLYGLGGQGHVTVDGERLPLGPGQVVHVAEGATKAITNGTDRPLVVLAVLVLDNDQPPFAPAIPDRPSG